MANPTNITPLITPELSATLTSSDQIISFGEQLIKRNAVPIITGIAGTILANKAKALTDIIEKNKQATFNQGIAIKKATADYASKKITKAQYENIIKNAKSSYQEYIATLKTNKKQIQESLTSETSIGKDIQAEIKKIKLKNTKLRTNAYKSMVKANLDLAKSVLTNPSALKAIYPVLGLLITNSFLLFITQRKKLEKQVDVVNLYIDTQVIDEPSVIVATNLKNNTIKAINDAIAKLKAIEGILKTINTALKIASTALAIISIILILVPSVPGAVLKIFTSLTLIIAGLSSIISPCVRILANEIQKLKELIEKLKQIVIKLNNKTLAILTDDQLLKLIQNTLPLGDVNPFPTLTAIPVSGSAGFVNIGGRIVSLNSTSAAGSIGANPSVTTGGTVGSTGTGTGTSTGTGGTTTIFPVTSRQINTNNTGTTNGTGTGITTTGGTGTGGVNIGPTGVIPNNINTVPGGNAGVNTNNTSVNGNGLGLDNGITSGLDVDGQLILAVDLNQFAIAGLDELTLDQLESFSLETLEDPQSLSSPSTSQVPSLQDQTGLYKGFRFQIKEEQDPRFVVRGTIKRRYAVAINRQGVEVLKSEYSFTLDPQDLVDQLKLIIDKQKLQG